MSRRSKSFCYLLALAWVATTPARADPPTVRSSGGGRWSDSSTWENHRIPAEGDRVQIRPGHAVVYDGRSEAPIRSIHVAGTLEFDPDRDTVLTVGLIQVQSGEDPGESGFDAHPAMAHAVGSTDRPALLVGTAGRPIAAGHSATIRLAEVAGLDPETCPAIVCRGGRMEFHGSPVNPTWAKLGEAAEAGASTVVLDRAVEGWRAGDRVIVTSTGHQAHRNELMIPKVREAPRTEERTIRAIDGPRLTLDAPLARAHSVRGNFRGEVALLGRNVVVESANPAGHRGHTMYHRDSVGSISFAEFRHLGKPGKLGKYSLHFHKAGDSMRGTSVVGASIWDSGNRWITIHGTNRLVIKDCVGYGSVGHGFFLEDGTEVDNILDGNLAVQATEGSPLPGQILAYDGNDGAGFWWANNRNAFARNVAVECDGYGFRLEAPPSVGPSTGPDDVRVQPFLRFDANEAHGQRRYGVNLGATHRPTPPGRAVAVPVGPDSRHPMAIKGLRIWDSRWGFSPATPGLTVDGLEIAYCDYAIFKANFDRQSYRGLTIYQCWKARYDIQGRPPDPAGFPKPLDPVDDRPPVSVIARVEPLESGRLRVRGFAADDGRIAAIRVNGLEARPTVADFSAWEVTLEATPARPITLTSTAEDSAGNVEPTPHVLTIPSPAGLAGPSPPSPVVGH